MFQAGARQRGVARLSIEVFKYPGGAAGTPVNLCTWHLGEAASLLRVYIHVCVYNVPYRGMEATPCPPRQRKLDIEARSSRSDRKNEV